MYKEMYKEYQARLRSKNITEDAARKRGILFLHTMFLFTWVSEECAKTIRASDIELHEIFGYVVPYHDMNGNITGEYKIYFLGKMQDVWPDTDSGEPMVDVDVSLPNA